MLGFMPLEKRMGKNTQHLNNGWCMFSGKNYPAGEEDVGKRFSSKHMVILGVM